MNNPKENLFHILHKCQAKFVQCMYGLLMLFIKELSPSLKTIADSICTKLFETTFFTLILVHLNQAFFVIFSIYIVLKNSTFSLMMTVV